MSKLILKEPFKISAGLHPALHIEGAWLECRDDTQFVIVFDEPHREYEIEGFSPGHSHTLQDCFVSILGFLSAWAESLDYGPESENYDLFPADDVQLRAWVEDNSDEIAILSVEIEETDALIEVAA